MSVSDKPWQVSQADYSPQQWAAACVIDRGTGDPASKDRYALPVKEPDGAVNRDGVHAAAARINQVQGITAGQRATAARKLVNLYENELNEEPPAGLEKMAGESEAADEKEDQMSQRSAGPVIECRSSAIADVNFAERIITTIAVPYEQAAAVPFGRPGEVWHEVFARGAFSTLEQSPHRVRVNRDHNKSRTVGKVIRFDPNSADGLVAETRMAKTPLGDETLALADDDCLGASVGFSCRSSGQHLDRVTRTRRISSAYLDHLSFVESPAYDNATVLSVRDTNVAMTSSLVLPAPTPALDEFLSDPVFQWSTERLNSSKP